MLSNRKHFKILESTVIVIHFVIQLFGFWPYSVDKTNRRHIKYNFLKFIYSLVFPMAVVYSYYTFGVGILQTPTKTASLMHSRTLGAISAVYALTSIFGFLSTYIEQHFKYGKRKMIYRKWIEIFEFIKSM